MINHILKNWKFLKIESIDKINMYLDSFRILFAYNSGKIENPEISYHDTREIFENRKLTGFTGDLRTIFEINNQRDCYDFLISKIADKEPITVELVKNIHNMLTKNTYDERRYEVNCERAGEFKKHDYVIGISEVGTAPEDVETEVKELIEELSDISKRNIITIAAYFHCRFEYIHPFADGNGRVGRTLLNYFFMINDFPPVIIYEENKRQYYEALQVYDETEDIEMMKGFLISQIEKTWAKSKVLNTISENSEITKTCKYNDNDEQLEV
ncbi:MAG: Fic family protein [Ruminiclostridium sp.]